MRGTPHISNAYILQYGDCLRGEENQDLESIILLDDTDAYIKDDEEPPAVQQSSAAFNTQEVITVLERISGSSEANLANAKCHLEKYA